MPASTSAPDGSGRRPAVIVRDIVRDRDPLPDEEGLGSLVGRVIEDARGLAAAEIALFKARVGERLTAYRGAAVFFAIAGVLALCGLIALFVGLILSLATLIGPGLATAAVVLTVFAIAGVLAMIGKGRLAQPKIDPKPASVS